MSMSKEEAFALAVKNAGGKKELAEAVGFTVRMVNYILEGKRSVSNYALKISMVSGVHVCELCPELYPSEVFGDVPVKKIIDLGKSTTDWGE